MKEFADENLQEDLESAHLILSGTALFSSCGTCIVLSAAF
jgi:hypothetical protein